MRHCTQCGGQIGDAAQFCRHCSAPVERRSDIAAPPRKQVRAQSSRNQTHRRNAGPSGRPAVAEAQVAEAQAAPVARSETEPESANDAGAPAAATFKGLPKAEALRVIAKAVIKAGAKSLALSALVLGPGFVLLLVGQVLFGMVWLFVGAFLLMAWTYRKPWRLSFVSCMIPPAVAAFCYALQLWLFGDAFPPAFMLLAAVAAGFMVGWFRGRAHEVYQKDGSIFAQRTTLYLGVWAAAYGITQLFGVIPNTILLTRGGLITGAFTTAMLAAVAVMLLGRRKKVMAELTALFFMGAAISMGFDGLVTKADAQSSYAEQFMPSQQLHINGFELTASQSASSSGRNHRYFYSGNYKSAEFPNPHIGIDLFVDDKPYVPEQGLSRAQAFQEEKDRARARHSRDTGAYRFENFSVGDNAYLVIPRNARPNGSSASLYFSTAGGQYRNRLDISSYYTPQLDYRDLLHSIARHVAARQTGQSAAAVNFPYVPPRGGGSRVDRSDAPATPPAGSGSTLIERPDSESPSPAQPPEPYHPPSPEEVAAVAAAIAAALAAAGIAASLAQAIAAAIANALQAGIELTADEINEAILHGLGLAASRDEAEPERAAEPPERPPKPPPVLDPKSGKPFETSAEGMYWAPDERGEWRWLSESEARDAARALGREKAQQDSDSARFKRESEERQTELKRKARERDETQRREEDEMRRKEAKRRAAIEDVDRIRTAAERMGLDEILTRSHGDQIYNDDGSVNVDYVNRLKQALKNRLARDVALSDHKLQRTSGADILQDTLRDSFKDASNSLFVRLGAGVATGGWSEAAFQGVSTLDAVQKNVSKAVDEGRDFSHGDALLTTAREFAKNNLPVNTADALRRLNAGQEVSMAELGMSMFADAAAMLEIGQTAGLKPGAALDDAAKRVLGAEQHTNIKKSLGDLSESVSQRINGINKSGTEAMDAALDRVGLRSSSSRLTPDLAEARFAKGRLSAETERLVADTKGSGATKNLDDAFESGRANGRKKVNALERSVQELDTARSGGKATQAEIDALERKLRDDVIRVQADKHALNELNKLPKTGGENAVIKKFNGEMEHIYRQADEKTIKRLADEAGVRPEDVQIVNITNMKGQPGLKIDPRAPARDHLGHASIWQPDGSLSGSRAQASSGARVNTQGTGPWKPRPQAPTAIPEPSGAKAGFDRDLTVRIRTVDPATGRVEMRDIPSTSTARIYNEELYKAAKGVDHAPTPSRPQTPEAVDAMKRAQKSIDFKDTHLKPSEHLADPMSITDADKFAKRLDQATTDRLHPEAYGTGQADLDAATKDVFRGRDFLDRAGTAKTVEFKVNHWMKEADELTRAADAATSPGERRQLLEAAIAHREEAQRQLVKQYGNMVITRTRAMQALGNAPGASIPRPLSEGMNVLKNVQTGQLTPAQAEAVLKSMGTSTEKLAGQMSSYVEGLQTLRAKTGPAPAAITSMPRIMIKGWQDDFQQDERRPV
ncbi:MAG: hypothetical protein BroJett029_32890 [Alphaproteobacteria bacterium]|nr:MAG: hypothetical protein BroJett029_32890 [Alphaproteobacteria bacterium]